MDRYRILVVDDEETLCEALRFNLEVEGYDVDVAYSAEQAMEMHPETYSLILLDVMMGEMSGFSMAQKLRRSAAGSSVPIIFCTAKDSEDDMVAGLNIGADDYIVKPYSIRNVLARVRTVLRRVGRPSEDCKETVSFEGLVLDMSVKRCTVDGRPVRLPRKEFELLALLMTNRDRVFSREEILARIWTDEVVVLDRTVDVNITRLRQKLGRYGRHIVTRSGYGYGFES